MKSDCVENKYEVFMCLRNAVMCGSAGQVYKMVKDDILDSLLEYAQFRTDEFHMTNVLKLIEQVLITGYEIADIY